MTAKATPPHGDCTYGLSHDVLGYVSEVVSGQTLDQFLRDRVFVPLDMTDTSFLVPESKRDRMPSRNDPSRSPRTTPWSHQSPPSARSWYDSLAQTSPQS